MKIKTPQLGTVISTLASIEGFKNIEPLLLSHRMMTENDSLNLEPTMNLSAASGGNSANAFRCMKKYIYHKVTFVDCF